MTPPTDHKSFKPQEIAKTFPESSNTLLLDQYLTEDADSSSRVFRVYRGTPPHFHQHSDEYLYVLSGRGTFWMASPENQQEFGPGDLLFFKKNTIHVLPDMLEAPIAFLAIDVPRRLPADITFVHPEEGTPDTFIAAASPLIRG